MIFTLKDGKHFYQWDKERVLVVLDETIDEVHFTNDAVKQAIKREVYDLDGQRLVDVPAALLQCACILTAYAYKCEDGEREYTFVHEEYRVIARKQPDDYIPESEHDKWEELKAEVIQALEDAQAAADRAAESEIVSAEIIKGELIITYADGDQVNLGRVGGGGGASNWEDLEGKPEAFPPEEHAHSQYLTELPEHNHDEAYAAVEHEHKEYLTDLPAHNHDETYAPKEHEHDEYFPKTGGTVKGEIVVEGGSIKVSDADGTIDLALGGRLTADEINSLKAIGFPLLARDEYGDLHITAKPNIWIESGEDCFYVGEGYAGIQAQVGDESSGIDAAKDSLSMYSGGNRIEMTPEATSIHKLIDPIEDGDAVPKRYVDNLDKGAGTFYAQYGVTTYTEIKEAYDAGKTVICKGTSGNVVGYLINISPISAAFTRFQGDSCISYVLMKENIWQEGKDTFSKYDPSTHFETTGGDTLTWDGNTEGLVFLDISGEGEMGMYHISNDAPVIADFANGYVVGHSAMPEPLTYGDNTTVIDMGNGLLMQQAMAFIICTVDSVVSEDFGGLRFEKGIYFQYAPVNDTYATSLTINGYTGFETTKLKPELLPTDAIDSIVEEALTEAKESGDFTPEKGVDYFTSADKLEIIMAVKNGIDVTGEVESALAEAKASGEFKGEKGDPGTPGYTPVKGTDYYTAADKTEMVNMVLSALPTWTGGSY